MAYGPIVLAYSSAGHQEYYESPEAASQTFKAGTPVFLVSGMVTACDVDNPWTSADVVLGIAATPGQNLTTANTPEPGASFATPPNQPNASTVALGTPFKSGKTLLYKADGQNVFRIQLASGTTFSQALVVAGTYYSLVYDSSTGYWYLDSADTSGNNAIAEIVGGVVGASECLFRIKAASRFFD